MSPRRLGGVSGPHFSFTRRGGRPMPVVQTPCRTYGMMPWLFGFYTAASLLHFAHNAEYLAQYPHLPVSWSRADVYFAWCCVSAFGILGCMLLRGGHRRAGLTVLSIYGGLGFGGLLHYTRAPVAHHSATMNLTIWTEVAAAAVFLINVATLAIQQSRPSAAPAA
jgi:hypothetical protein